MPATQAAHTPMFDERKLADDLAYLKGAVGTNCSQFLNNALCDCVCAPVKQHQSHRTMKIASGDLEAKFCPADGSARAAPGVDPKAVAYKFVSSTSPVNLTALFSRVAGLSLVGPHPDEHQFAFTMHQQPSGTTGTRVLFMSYGSAADQHDLEAVADDDGEFFLFDLSHEAPEGRMYASVHVNSSSLSAVLYEDCLKAAAVMRVANELQKIQIASSKVLTLLMRAVLADYVFQYWILNDGTCDRPVWLRKPMLDLRAYGSRYLFNNAEQFAQALWRCALKCCTSGEIKIDRMPEGRPFKDPCPCCPWSYAKASLVGCERLQAAMVDVDGKESNPIENSIASMAIHVPGYYGQPLHMMDAISRVYILRGGSMGSNCSDQDNATSISHPTADARSCDSEASAAADAAAESLIAELEAEERKLADQQALARERKAAKAAKLAEAKAAKEAKLAEQRAAADRAAAEKAAVRKAAAAARKAALPAPKPKAEPKKPVTILRRVQPTTSVVQPAQVQPSQPACDSVKEQVVRLGWKPLVVNLADEGDLDWMSGPYFMKRVYD